jgi:SNF2 family DNA or RNA helicase
MLSGIQPEQVEARRLRTRDEFLGLLCTALCSLIHLICYLKRRRGEHAPRASLCVDDHLPRAARIHIIGIESMSASNRTVLAYAAIVTEQSFVVVDESSYIKGHNSLRTLRISALSAKTRYRLILTGTPFSNGIADLYAQMAFLSKKILGYASFYSFAANHLEYEMRRDSLGIQRRTNHVIRAHNVEYLAAKISPYVYQVRKGECLDLPEKLYDIHYFRMTEQQRQAYEQAKEEILSMELEDWTDIALFRVFTALQAIVCGFWTRTDPQTRKVQRLTFEHARVEALLNVVAQIPSDEKIIIWAKYQHAIGEIRAALRLQGGEESLAEFHGAISLRRRYEELRRWQKGSARYLLPAHALVSLISPFQVPGPLLAITMPEK